MVRTIFLMIVIAAVAIAVLYINYFSPKARIKRLWEEVFRLTHELAELRKKLTGESIYHFNVSYGRAIKKRYSLINGILDYYFDPEADEEYINQHRPDDKAKN